MMGRIGMVRTRLNSIVTASALPSAPACRSIPTTVAFGTGASLAQLFH